MAGPTDAKLENAMKMKAAAPHEQGRPRPYADSRPMTIEEVDLDPPGPGEVLCKIVGAGLRHSDLSTIENLRPRKLPTIPGHEAAGIVEEVGPGVVGLKPGDRVIGVFVASCHDCRYCNGGRPNLCQSSNASRANGTLISGARRLSLNGEPIHHYSGLSVFAQYAVVRLPVHKLRSGYIGVEEIDAGFDRLSDGSAPRQIQQPHA